MHLRSIFATCVVLSYQPVFWHQKQSLQVSFLYTGILWCLRNSSTMLRSFVPLSKLLLIFPVLNYTSLLWRANNNTSLHVIRSMGHTKRASVSLLSFALLRAQERNLIIDPVRIHSMKTWWRSRFKEVAKLSLYCHQKYFWQVGHPRC